jgi:hypothetical protein
VEQVVEELVETVVHHPPVARQELKILVVEEVVVDSTKVDLLTDQVEVVDLVLLLFHIQPNIQVF